MLTTAARAAAAVRRVSTVHHAVRALCVRSFPPRLHLAPPHPQGARMASSGLDLSPQAFMQDSVIPTMHYQPSLPRLPIPDLDKTCERCVGEREREHVLNPARHPACTHRYLYSVKPLVSPEQFATTAALVEEFRTGQGKELQAALVAHDKANSHTSYISGALHAARLACPPPHTPAPPQTCGSTCTWRIGTPSP